MVTKSKTNVPARSEAGATPRDAEATRARILEAARIRFSQVTYEGVGLREIAADANVDVALIARYFGSKEGLFREIAEHAFGTHDLLVDGPSGLPQRARDMLMGALDDKAWREGYDPLRLLLASLGSPVAGPIASECLERDFMRPLAESIGGKSADERSAIVTAQIVGIAFVRLVLSGKKRHPRANRLAELTERMMQGAVGDGTD